MLFRSINALTRRGLARTSATPGKTRLLNAYRVRVTHGRSLLLIDLPGYGFAGPEEHGFDALIAGYFDARRTSAQPTLALHAVDGRHPGLDSDLAAHEWLKTTGVTIATVVTKIDKLKQSERARHMRDFAAAYTSPLVAVSAERGEGLETLWTTIRKLLLPSS